MITFVLGTRAELIKTMPIMKELEKRGIDYCFIHTGQHNIDELLKEFRMKKPDYQLDYPDKVAGRFKNLFQTFLWNIKVGIKLSCLLKKINPEYVIVQGDTMSTAVASFFTKVLLFNRPKVCHVEAGLRSHSILEPFPEEICRRIADFFADILFAPTKEAAKNLKSKQVYIVGNTVIDAVKLIKQKIKKSKKSNFIIAMVHRQENIKSKTRMIKFIKIITKLKKKYKILFISHPHSVDCLKKFDLWKYIEGDSQIKINELLKYSKFIRLLIKSKGIITDSGGIAEECCELKKPCLIFRKKTERVEAIKAGFAKIIFDSNINEIKSFLEKNINQNVKNPYGDGTTSKKIVDILLRE
ncbi:MAG: UDP-N-acetylglucosamine 2-epimerase (non-hydrolyzing) [Candidatus Aenigmatarchaeota archaeon]